MDIRKFGGIWKINNDGKSFNGELILKDYEGMIRLAVYYECDEEIFADTSIPTRIDFITGILSNSAKITLCNCEVINRHTQNFTFTTIIIDCEYMFDGIIFESFEDIKFHKVDFDVSEIIGWSGLSGLSFPKVDGYSHVVGYRFPDILAYDIDEVSQVAFVPKCGSRSSDRNVREYIIEQSVIISIRHSSDLSLNESVAKLRRVLGLISIAIGKVPDIIKVEGFNKNHMLQIKEKSYDKPIRIYFNNSYKEQYTEPPIYRNLFLLKDLTKKESDYIINWFTKYNAMEPIIELYLAVLSYNSMSIERHFLNLAQALETYHMRLVCRDLSDFLHRIQSCYKNESQDRDLYEIINDATQKSQKYVLIRSRLLDLIFDENQSMLFFSSRINQIKFIDKVVNTRHYHTHYAENKKDKSFQGSQLETATLILMLLLELYFMKELGLDKKVIMDNFKKKIYNFKDSIQELEKLL